MDGWDSAHRGQRGGSFFQTSEFQYLVMLRLMTTSNAILFRNDCVLHTAINQLLLIQDGGRDKHRRKISSRTLFRELFRDCLFIVFDYQYSEKLIWKYSEVGLMLEPKLFIICMGDLPSKPKPKSNLAIHDNNTAI